MVTLKEEKRWIWDLNVNFFPVPFHPTAVPSEGPTMSGPVEEPEPVCVARGWRSVEEH